MAALAAGPLPWREGRAFTNAETLAIGAAAFAASIVAISSFVVAGQRWVPVAIGTVGLLGTLGPEVVVALSDRVSSGVLEKLRTTVRTLGFLTALVGFAISLRWLGVFVFVPAGIDAAVTTSVIGTSDSPASRLRGLLRDPFVASLAFGLVAGALLTRHSTPRALAAAAWITAGIALGGFACSQTRSWMHQITIRERRDLSTQRERDARHVGGWLHDQVWNPIRTMRIKLEDGFLIPTEVAAELDRLEAMLRTGQVEYLIDQGFARLGDITDPYLRLAERYGVTIVDLPAADLRSLPLGAHEARLVSRTIGILVNNALQAGTRNLSLRARLQHRELTLEVEDDAGGIDTTNAFVGRSLSQLHDALGGAFEINPTGNGTLATARMTLP